MNTQKHNPLLNHEGLPAFSRIRPEHVVPAVEQSLAEARATVAVLETRATPGPRWDDLIPPLEALDDGLNRVWLPVEHLHAVADNPELRDAYNTCLPMLSDYSTELGQNGQLFHACRRIAEGEEMANLAPEKRKILGNTLLDFRLSGVALAAKDKARFKALSTRLSKLESRFAENVLDATGAWEKHITQHEALSGLPDTALALARKTAEREGRDGWLLTLEFPAYLSVMTFADDRALRREIYEAYTTRASDRGPHAGQWDNTAVMEEILALRDEKAHLLGFDNYLDYSLVKKMVPNGATVFTFLRDLARRAKPMAERELREVRAFAGDVDGIGMLEAWDIPYYSERLRQHAFAFSQEELRPYFPLPKVLSGLFYIVNRLFGLHIRPAENEERWHPDVDFYEIRDGDGALQGSFFLDLYARPHKRGGAWMGECLTRKALGHVPGGARGDDIQPPVAHLVCNFSPPLEGKPSLLTHEEVLTLFHEFGHGLHHLLTKVDYPSIAGVNGVAWDAVELPSQLLELWCWEQAALQQFSGHVGTGEPLPDALLEKLGAARNFQSGMAMVRQLEYSLFDLRIHGEYDRARGARIGQFLDEVREEVAVLNPPPFHRFAHSFSHIFAGSYAAGYYSYKWAEVLASDAFSLFEENGIFDGDTGALFQRTVLEQGGARDAMDLFVAFRGREPTIDALLRHHGINDE
uniref:oligopeptidase A n=1 Tax=Candidatus Kentrum eta TaxID=2126337 RepID=A0A450VJJ4_9GAMM|nr:MAG: oligopeptidase A [Candidatus Kentron sp. H]VFK01410.1 MAG: oligopeptidase A [Candidatus Kentron sp. H]VFK04973.1 MAG: oligopeptidase A [Candidatus Kentron sp. H]